MWTPDPTEPWFVQVTWIPADGTEHVVHDCDCEPVRPTPGVIIHRPRWAYCWLGPFDGQLLPADLQERGVWEGTIGEQTFRYIYDPDRKKWIYEKAASAPS